MRFGRRFVSPWMASLAFALACPGADAAPAAAAEDVIARRDYPLKTPRSRDPVLGGARDTAFVSVWLPAGVKTVRGLVCNPFSKGDSVGGHWRAMCAHWRFGYVQTDFDAVKKEEYDLLFRGLADLARDTGHPELEHAPLCYTGMSRGGGMSVQLAELRPERALAAAPVCLEVGPTTAAGRLAPMVTIFGEKDGAQMPRLLEKLPTQRAESARWAIAPQWDRKHEFGQANNLSFVFFDEVISRRLPAEFEVGRPVPLREIPVADGWLGDVATWNKNGLPPTIAAHADYQGDPARACWFPSKRAAAAWRAFVSASKEVKIEQPAGLGDGQKFTPHAADEPLTVTVAVVGKVIVTKVELWDADTLLGERAAGPFTFEVKLGPGPRALHAVVHAGDAPPRCSRPHTIVVRNGG